MSEELIPIDLIVVKDRHRTDLGDLSDLAASIADVGLLQPIGITSTYRLVFGGRRLAACKQLGMDKVPVRFLANRDDAAAILKAERDENTCRLDMKPSELVALGEALEEMERPKAKERQTATQFGPDGAAPVTSTDGSPKRDDSGYTRTVVSEALGMSGQTYDRMKHVVNTANDPTKPTEVREAAKEAVQEMDATGVVKPAYDKVRAAEMGHAPATDPRRMAKTPGSSTLLVRILSQLKGITVATEGGDFADLTITHEQSRQLDEGIRCLVRLRRVVTEETA